MDFSHIHSSWQPLLSRESSKPYFSALAEKVESEYATHQCFPPEHAIFRAFELTPLDEVKVVILGQDPYHDDGQAQGLAFSVPDGMKLPPSLRNIAKELESEMGYPCIDVEGKRGDLSLWARQGVLLLNTTLTVRAHEAASHAKLGWGEFTDAVIGELDSRNVPMVFMLWGKHAQSKRELLRNPGHLVLESVHPSPLSASRGFFGCGHFAKANEYLVERGIEPIEWRVNGNNVL